jgi:lipid-binding SYLF domain-containing protein
MGETEHMKRLVVLLSVVACAVPALAQVPQNLINRLDAAQQTLNTIMATPDKSIPQSILEEATCVGVVPGLLKGAFFVGAEHGEGVVTCRTPRGWSAPVFISMTGGSVGFQWGIKGTDLVLVAVNNKGFQDLLQSKFKIGAGASAAAGPVGRDAGAATNLKMQSELLTWSRSRGVFAGIDLNGVSVTQNKDDTQLLYGAPHSFKTILNGDVAVPHAARPFVRTVAKYFHESQQAK